MVFEVDFFSILRQLQTPPLKVLYRSLEKSCRQLIHKFLVACWIQISPPDASEAPGLFLFPTDGFGKSK
jgi:hypothetical protein